MRGRSRTPTLLYGTQQAHPTPVVRANVTMPSGTVTSSTATLSLIVNGSPTTVATQSFSGAQLPGDAVRRVVLSFDGAALATGIYPYTLTLTVNVAGNPTPVSLQASDTLAIVNRGSSPYGAGWSLAGHEALITLPNSEYLLVGGDGSTRRYRPRTVGGVTSTTVWVTDSITGPDSIVSPPFSGRFVRYLPQGTRVVFDAAGRHTATVDRLGDSTRFVHDANGTLQSIGMPAGGLAYTFQYDGSGKVSRIDAPAVAAGARATLFAITGGKLVSLTDPDGWSTAFGYSAVVDGVLTSRTDKLGVARSFAHDGAGRLSSTAIQARSDGSQPIVWSACAAESRGLLGSGACGGSETIDTADARTSIDGPRSAVADTWNIAVSRHGAVERFRIPSGGVTTLRRTDSRFSGLVTEQIDAVGLTQQFFYDARGNLTQRWELDPLEDGVPRVTTFEYASAAWPDGVTRVTRPMNGFVAYTYDSTGNVRTRENNYGSYQRTVFDYGTSGNGRGLLARVVHPTIVSGRVDFDSLQYDGLGNVSSVRTATRSGGTTRILRASHDTGDAAGRPASECIDLSIGGTPQRCTTTEYDRMGRDSAVRVTAPSPSQILLTITERDREGRPRFARRSSSPDPAGIGTITTEWRYDQAGRAVAEVAPDNAVDSTTFDEAGNAVRVRTRRGDTLVMTYGRSNELLTRITPSVTYLASTPTGSIGASDNQPYPWRPNSGTSYTIAADTAVYAYDPALRMTHADNREARVTRNFFRGGALRSELLETRNDSGPTFGHSYLTRFTYDRDGRRHAVRLPSQLVAGTRDSIAIDYDPITELPVTITDPLGNEFRYGYDDRERPSYLTYPGAYQRNWTYSAAGDDTTDVVSNFGGTGGGRVPLTTLRNTRFTFDARGNRLTSDDAAGLQERQRFAYSGLGAVTSTNFRQYGRVFYVGGSQQYVSLTGETVQYDALGNATNTTTGDTLRQERRVG